MKKNLLNKKGFTLIELIVVIAILAILALILVPSITGYISSATTAKNKANARTVYSELALEQAKDDNWDLSKAGTISGGCVISPATAGKHFEDLESIKCGGDTFTVVNGNLTP